MTSNGVAEFVFEILADRIRDSDHLSVFFFQSRTFASRLAFE